jgi:hypothetical protein
MPTIAELIRDGKAKQSIGGSLRDFVQGASNAAAGAVSGPVDLVSMGLQGAGLPMPAAPFGGSQWMRDRGLIRDPENRTAGLLGESLGNVLPIVAAAKAPQIARGLLQAGDNLRAPTPMNTATGGQAGAIVYHGSPHKFDKFDSSKIGTGEGAQAYGHGMYFAESKDVAKTYQPRDLKYEEGLMKLYKRAESLRNYDALEVLENAMMHRSPAELRQQYGAAAEATVKQIEKLPRTVGNMYKVDLPDEQIAKMLDWDAPWSKQPESVRKAIDTSALETFYRTKDMPTSQVLFHLNQGRTPAQAAEYLRSLGVPGTRYLDGGSRTAGAGSSNYVVFPGNESLLNILSRE